MNRYTIRTTAVYVPAEGGITVTHMGGDTLSYGTTSAVSDGTLTTGQKKGLVAGNFFRSSGLTKITVEGDMPGIAEGELLFSVKDYGALGDGSTDDTAAIQATLDAAPDGGTVYLPVGTYAISGELSVPTKVDLLGAGKHAAVLSATDAAATLRFGTMGGGSATVNYGGMSGGFKFHGNDIATTLVKVGLVVGRQFQSIELTHADENGLLLEQTQNSAFTLVDVSYCGESGVVLDWGAGGNAFYKCEFYGSGHSNGRHKASGTASGGGYAVVTHTLYSHCLFEGTQASTVACFDHGAGTRTVFDSCHMTLFSGANGHADLYGTEIPVFRMAKDSEGAAHFSNRAIFVGGSTIFGSKPAASTDYVGTGVDISNSPGQGSGTMSNAYFAPGTVISQCATAFKLGDSTTVQAEGVAVDSNTARFANQTDGTAAEKDLFVHGFFGATPVARAAKINDPSGGETEDAEARTAINSIIDVLERFGFSATS